MVHILWSPFLSWKVLSVRFSALKGESQIAPNSSSYSEQKASRRNSSLPDSRRWKKFLLWIFVKKTLLLQRPVFSASYSETLCPGFVPSMLCSSCHVPLARSDLAMSPWRVSQVKCKFWVLSRNHFKGTYGATTWPTETASCYCYRTIFSHNGVQFVWF